MIISEYNPVLRYEYRQRLWSGSMRIRGSVTHEQEFDRDGGFGDRELRGHVAGSGAFNIAPGWIWRFNVQLATDPLYLARYDLNGDIDQSSDFCKVECPHPAHRDRGSRPVTHLFCQCDRDGFPVTG